MQGDHHDPFSVLGMHRHHGELVVRALAGESLAAAGIDVAGQRLPHLLSHAELAGVLTSGPT